MIFPLFATARRAAAALSLAASAWPGLAPAGTLHVHTSDEAGFHTHSIWYDDGREVTVIDAQFTAAHAQRLIDDIRRQTPSTIARVIVTHPNPDKFNGLSVFHAIGATSLASAATAAAMPAVDAYKRHFWVDLAHAFTEQTYPRMEPVRQTFDRQLTLRLPSGETLSLFELPGPGVSSNQTVVRIDATGDLVVGDLVHARHHAWLEGPIVAGQARATLASWRADLAELPKLGRGRVYGGRGEFLPVEQAVREQTGYLETVERLARRYVADLGARRSELDEPTRRKPHEQALQALIRDAYPNYASPEMVGYSVYGLIQALRSEQP